MSFVPDVTLPRVIARVCAKLLEIIHHAGRSSSLSKIHICASQRWKMFLLLQHNFNILTPSRVAHGTCVCFYFVLHCTVVVCVCVPADY